MSFSKTMLPNIGELRTGEPSENSVNRKFNFRESPKGELRRIPLPRTSVNTGKKKRKDQGFLQPRPRCSAANLLTRYNPRCRLFRYPPP